MTVEKPKPKQLHRPIGTGADSAMNQSQFLAITCNSLKAREKSRLRGEIGFGFDSHWLKNWRESFKRSNRNHVITFDSHLKIALRVKCTVAHKGHYALFHNTFRIIKYAFQIMHNTFPILRNTFWIHYKFWNLRNTFRNLRNTFRNLHNTFAPGPQVLAEKKETVTQLLLLPSMLCFVPRVENLCKFRSNFVLNAGRILPQISPMEE